MPGDTFIFGGRLLKFESIREGVAITTKGTGEEPKVPAYMGGRLPLTTTLADAVQRYFQLMHHCAEAQRIISK